VADVLVDDAPPRLHRLALVCGGLLVALVAGAGALRSTLPPPPLEVRIAGLSGTALKGESFVRLHVVLEQSGARTLDEAVLSVAGTRQRGQHATTFDDGRLTVQVDVVPACASLLPEVAAGVLDLRVHDASGDARRVRLSLPADGQLERLLRYRCTERG
jgi:hypothetical protein